MEELIKKDGVIILINNERDMNTLTDWGRGYMDGLNTIQKELDLLPTTTEAEIIEKAISDFLQFVYDNARNEEYVNEDGWAMSDLIDLEYKFVKQLKEE